MVVFAVGVIGYALATTSSAEPDEPQRLAEAAARIEGITVRRFDGGVHLSTPITYQEHPAMGGPHDPQWADCTGTVYDQPIREENAVHALEHGTVWITYDPSLPTGDIDVLRAKVEGQDHSVMSP